MNRQEAARVLAVIAAPYGGEPIEADGAEAWFHSTLERCDYADAIDLAQLLIANEEFRPTPAVFNRELRTRRQHERIAGAAMPALPPAPPRPGAPSAVQVIDDLRQRLSGSGARKHWHGGPNPCPVCGGGA